jgi:hypothetical protein
MHRSGVVRPTPPAGKRVSVLGTAPWRRAPLLLRRSPAVLLAVPGGATAWPAGRELLAVRERTVRRAASLMPNLGPPVLAMSGPQVQLTGAAPGRLSGGRLLYRDGFEGQIRTLASAPGVTGVWLPGGAAAQLGVRPGDRVTVSLPQALGLLEDLTVRENVALPVGRRRTGGGRTEELLGLFGLAELADRSPSELVATHDPDALEFADRVLHLADGELTEREL